jgi:uracil-DNA glycosylase family 4
MLPWDRSRIGPPNTLNPDDRKRALDEIAAEVAVCTLCPLHKGRTLAVPGEGHPETEVVFIGEGPGYNEDREGRPFVGQAGGLLNELLKAIGWRREEVFITNVVKCRPPGNRDPEPSEIAACAPYLERQLTVLDPAVIVTLGRHSLQTFMPGARISATHGTARPTDPATGATDATTYAMYHPAAALRQGSLKETMLTDMCGLPDVLIEARERRAAKVPVVAGSAPHTAGEAATGVDTSAPEPVPQLAAQPQDETALEAALESMPEPTLEEVDAALETAAVVSSPAAGAEPQLELFG